MASNTQQCVIEREMYLYETESEHGETNEETKKILCSKCYILFCAQSRLNIKKILGIS